MRHSQLSPVALTSGSRYILHSRQTDRNQQACYLSASIPQTCKDIHTSVMQTSSSTPTHLLSILHVYINLILTFQLGPGI